MHELSIVESIYDVVMEKVREYGAGRVLRVRLAVGELAGVEDWYMKSCFAVFVQKTPAEGAELLIEHIPARVRCRRCGREYETKLPFSGCAACGSESIRIVAGKELYIDSLEVE